MQTRISPDEAYNKAKDYFDKKNYLESQAYLTEAVKLGSEQADFAFCTYGFIKPFNASKVEEYFSNLVDSNSEHKGWLSQFTHSGTNYKYSIFMCMLVVIILSGNKSTHLTNLGYVRNSVYFGVSDWKNFKPNDKNRSWIIETSADAVIFNNANNTKNPPSALLNEDTMLNKLACRVLSKSPQLLFEFINYCVRNDILSLTNYKLLLKFVEEFSKEQKQNLEKYLEIGYLLASELEAPQKNAIQPYVFSTTQVMQALNQQPSSSILTISPSVAVNPITNHLTRHGRTVNVVPSYPFSHIPFSIHAPQTQKIPKQKTIVTELQPVYLSPKSM